MINNQNKPRKFDIVMGGGTPPPLYGAVLGGIQGVKQRLASSEEETRIGALSRAITYGDAGLNLVIQALGDNSAKVRKTAARLLKNIDNIQVKVALNKYKFWTTFEKYYDIPDNHATTFANRKVIEFDPITGISDTVDTAYALRVIPEYFTKSIAMSSVDKLQVLLQSPLASQVEALVFGLWYPTSEEDYTFRPVMNALLESHEKLTNVKALFLGDVNKDEWKKITLVYSNLSYLLLAYPQLEILKIRTNSYRYYYYSFGLEFSPIRHENLKALIIEGSDISNEIIEEVGKLELPALEYLELWLGGDRGYIYEFINIFYNVFPKLRYLGIRNYNNSYSENIPFPIINSPIIENLVELDISMGKMGDEGANALLNCPAIRQLDTLNISHNCLTDEMIEKLNQLNIEVISEKQEPYRYWSAYE